MRDIDFEDLFESLERSMHSETHYELVKELVKMRKRMRQAELHDPECKRLVPLLNTISGMESPSYKHACDCWLKDEV